MEYWGVLSRHPQQHRFHVVELKSSAADVLTTFLHDRGRFRACSMCSSVCRLRYLLSSCRALLLL